MLRICKASENNCQKFGPLFVGLVQTIIVHCLGNLFQRTIYGAQSNYDDGTGRKSGAGSSFKSLLKGKQKSLTDPRGGVQGTQAASLGPTSFIFMQLLTKILPNNKLRVHIYPSQVLRLLVSDPGFPRGRQL